MHAHDELEIPWAEDAHVLKCSPSQLQPDGALLLDLGDGHGKELAIHRLDDDAWFFLVVVSPPAEMANLMEPGEFAVVRRVEVPASTVWPEWTTPSTADRIFKFSGKYMIYTSENLESEQGGYRCAVKYIGHER